ncbi:MAG: FeoA family protein [Marinagarivorans sp.]
MRIAYDNEFHLRVIPMQALTAEYLSPDAQPSQLDHVLPSVPRASRFYSQSYAPIPHLAEQGCAVTARMKALGFSLGVQLKVIGYGLFGRDPLAVQINGTKFALRRAEAQKLIVIPL